MSETSRLHEWLGAIGRVIAFAALSVLLVVGLGYLYSTLSMPAGTAAMILGASVQAAAALLAGAVLIRGLDRRSPAALGIGVSRDTLPLSLIGLVIGALGIGVGFVILLATGMVEYSGQSGTASQWVTTLIAHGTVFAVAALAEEAVFRGYAFQALVRGTGAPVAIILSSAAFTWAHGSNPNVGAFALVNIFLAGVMFAVAYLRTFSLWFVTAVHLGWNWAMATLLDLPVSGIEQFDTPLYEPTVSGPEWFSGGVFGPEGGIVGTLGLTVALCAVLWLPRVRPDAGVVAAAPLALEGKQG